MTAGQTYDGYQIVRVLGGGNMGKVYLAVRHDTGQQVALKIVTGGDSPEALERIAVEKGGAQLQQKLSSNGIRDARIVTVHRIFQQDGDLGIEMEYVEGEDLYKVLRRGVLDPKRAAAIAVALCDMITSLGRTTVLVHGDLKPSNVLINRQDQVKVIDFGIAKEMEKTGHATYNPYQSAAYSSPERLATARVDANSDLWAVGVMLYEMVAGRRPFGAKDEDLRTRVQFGPDPLPPSVPQALARILFKMLSPSPGQRYGSSADCAADLRRFLNGQPVNAPDPGEATRRTAPPSDAEATRRTGPVPNVQGRRDPGTVPISGQPVTATATMTPRVPRRRWSPLLKLGIFGAIVLTVIWFVSSQYNTWTAADDLQRRLASRQIMPENAWAPWQDLQKRAKLPLLIYGLRQRLETQLIERADEVIQDYRRDQPTAREGDWARALVNLQHALELDPNNKTLSARLYICDAHLQRIRAHGAARAKGLNAAIVKFEAAAKLMPDWRDPYLGLARIYLYDLNDYDKGMNMIEEAVKHGHTAGKRERTQIADALRGRGLRVLAEASQFADMPDQEKRYLQRARDDFRSAAQYYAEVGDFTRRAAALQKEMLQRVQSIEDRLANK